MDFYSASTLKQQSADSRSTRTHYPDSEPTCPYSFSLILCAYRRSNQCYFYSLYTLTITPPMRFSDQLIYSMDAIIEQ